MFSFRTTVSKAAAIASSCKSSKYDGKILFNFVKY